ncbi:MAG: hypothetical protein IIC03_10400 [Proteobacteria bacterium]|nr:hypothetical protein [Pseudomonadota bacterium]
MKRNATTYLISNGDFRDAACVECWPMQKDTLNAVAGCMKKLGRKTEVLPKYSSKRKHGFVTRQCEGTELFSQLDADAPVQKFLKDAP